MACVDRTETPGIGNGSRTRSATAGSPSCCCRRSTPTRLRYCWMRAVPGLSASRRRIVLDAAEGNPRGRRRGCRLALQLLRRAALRCWTIDLGTGTRAAGYRGNRSGGCRGQGSAWGGDTCVRVTVRARSRGPRLPCPTGRDPLCGHCGSVHAGAGGSLLSGRSHRPRRYAKRPPGGCASRPGSRVGAGLAFRPGRRCAAAGGAFGRRGGGIGPPGGRDAPTATPGGRAVGPGNAREHGRQRRGGVNLAAEAEGLALAVGSNMTLALIQNSRAMAPSDAGRPDEAFEQLWRIYRPADPAHHRMQACWAIGSLAEYAMASGHHEQAADGAREARTPCHADHIDRRAHRGEICASTARGPMTPNRCISLRSRPSSAIGHSTTLVCHSATAAGCAAIDGSPTPARPCVRAGDI